MSSVSLLMGVESNSGTADARATVAKVAARLSPLPNCCNYVPELPLANLRTGRLLHGTQFSRLSDPECHHPGPTGRCHTASD